LLEEFARHDPSIHLKEFKLPAGEVATRDAFAPPSRKELLSQSGDEFELTLLLTQTEALSYAWHLAKSHQRERTQPSAPGPWRLEQDMENLYHEVFAALAGENKMTGR